MSRKDKEVLSLEEKRIEILRSVQLLSEFHGRNHQISKWRPELGIPIGALDHCYDQVKESCEKAGIGKTQFTLLKTMLEDGLERQANRGWESGTP